jgi:aquaporin Z
MHMRIHEKSAITVARRAVAEFAGTFLLILGVIGTALFMSPTTGVLGVVLAVVFVVVAAAYAVGPISGAHLNPVVTLAVAAAGRLPWRDVPAYVIAQTAGGLVAAVLLYFATLGAGDGAAIASFLDISNGWDEGSPQGYNVWVVSALEFILAALLAWIVLETTAPAASAALAPLAIGMALGLMHLIAIPVSNASLSPVRSLATAIFAGGSALSQVWLFLVVPLAGGLIGGWLYRWVASESRPALEAKSA